MSVYKIFPSADASLYSAFPAKNTGLDEILEVSVKNSNNPTNFFVDPVPSTPLLSDDLRRSIIRFSTDDIATLADLLTGEEAFNVNLRLYLANAENLNIPYTLEFKQIDDNWTMGTGKFIDNPETRNGVCWYNTGSYSVSSSNWTNANYYITPGGGSWDNTDAVTQSFDYKDKKDINVNVLGIVQNWWSGQPNYGILIKHSSSIENDPNSYIVTNFFSTDTHTIFPPCLELKWDDSLYDTGSLTVVSTSSTVLNVSNNPYNIKSTTGKYQFRVTARDKYPIRTFTTASLYTVNKALPQTSYWSIQDVKTEDVIIDFDDTFTKISCDNLGSYFNVYMSGLEPERYYKILIKIVLDSGESLVIDNDNIFKIVR